MKKVSVSGSCESELVQPSADTSVRLRPSARARPAGGASDNPIRRRSTLRETKERENERKREWATPKLHLKNSRNMGTNGNGVGRQVPRPPDSRDDQFDRIAVINENL